MNNSQSKSVYPEYNGLKFIPGSKVQSIDEFKEKYPNVSKIIGYDKIRRLLYIKLEQYKNIIIGKISKDNIVLFHEAVSDEILKKLNNETKSEQKIAIDYMLQGDFINGSEKIYGTTKYLINQIIAEDLLDISIEEFKFQYPSLYRLVEFEDNAQVLYFNGIFTQPLGIKVKGNIIFYKDIDKKCLERYDNDIFNDLGGIEFYEEDFERNMNIDSFQKEYPHLIMLMDVESEIISYQEDEIIHQIGVILEGKDITLFNDMNTDFLTNLDEHAKNNPKLQNKFKGLLGDVFKGKSDE